MSTSSSIGGGGGWERPSRHCTVQMLGNSSTIGIISHYDVHPIHTWVLCASNTVILTYDYTKHIIISRKTLKDIFASIHHIGEKKIVIATPAQSKISSVFTTRTSFDHKVPSYFVNRAISDRYDRGLPVASTGTTATASSANTTNFGAIRSIHFADYSALRSKSSGQNPSFHLGIHPIHSTSLIMIIFESAIILHDMLSDKTRTITSNNDLDKANPVSAEFIHIDILAIGCSDGVIRLWDVSQWTLVKSLLAHSKTSKTNDVCALKSIPDSTSSNISTENACDVIQFLSIAHDNIGYIWQGKKRSTIVDISEPIAILKNQKKDSLFTSIANSLPTSQYYDSRTSLLYTVSSNHKTRVWDLSSLPSLTSSSSRPSSSRSYAAIHSTALASQNSSKTNLQSSPVLPSTTRRRPASFKMHLKAVNLFKGKAEVAAATSACGVSALLQIPCVSVIKPRHSLAQLGKLSHCCVLPNLNLYPGGCALLFSNRSESLYMTVAYSPAKAGGGTGGVPDDLPSEVASTKSGSSDGGLLSANKMLTIVDTFDVTSNNSSNTGNNKEVKVISCKFHDLHRDHGVLLTSTGLCLLTYKDIVPTGPYTSGTHTLWGSTCLLFDPTTRVIIQKSSADDEIDESVNAATLDSSHHSSSQVKLEPGMTSSPSVTNAESSNIYSITTEYHCVQNASTPALSYLSSVPMFYPSPSGHFCIVHWPQSMQYIMLRLATTESTSTSNLFELEHGICSSIGWIGGSEDLSNVELFGMIIPEKRVILEKKKGLSEMLVFSSKKEDDVAITPSQLVFKQVEGNICVQVKVYTENCIHGGWSPIAIRGGPVLCMTLAKEDAANGRTPETRYMSEFYRLVPNISNLAAEKRKKIDAEDPEKPKYRLNAVDRAVKEVSSVSWLYLKERDVFYGGVSIDGRVNIVLYKRTVGNVKSDFELVKSIEVSSSSPSPHVHVSRKTYGASAVGVGGVIVGGENVLYIEGVTRDELMMSMDGENHTMKTRWSIESSANQINENNTSVAATSVMIEHLWEQKILFV